MMVMIMYLVRAISIVESRVTTCSADWVWLFWQDILSPFGIWHLHCILHFAFCILHFALCILYFSFCILSPTLLARHPGTIWIVFGILHLAFCILQIESDSLGKTSWHHLHCNGNFHQKVFKSSSSAIFSPFKLHNGFKWKEILSKGI